MPTTRRSRTLDAPAEAVWGVVGDPSYQPRWWPKVARVEGVQAEAFTRVYATSKGKPIRADFRIAESDPPRRRRWVQVLEGTPFAKFMREAEEVVDVEPVDDGRTKVVLEARQKLRGLSRFGGFLVRRATRRQLDEALDALERVL